MKTLVPSSHPAATKSIVAALAWRNGRSPPGKRGQALFFEVMALNADQRCSTFLLLQCGQVTFSVSCSAMVEILERVFLQAWQKNP